MHGTATNPISGSNDNNPKISGLAAAFVTTVQLYTDAACTVPIGSPTARATFESPGITVNVPDNSTTNFYAKATASTGTGWRISRSMARS